MFRYLLLVAMLILSSAVQASGLPRELSVPGGIAVVPLPPPIQSAHYLGQRVLVLEHDGMRYAIVGIPLDTKPGTQHLDVTLDGQSRSLAFHVTAKHYAIQRLTIDNKGQVTLSPANLARVKRERQLIDAVYEHWTPTLYATLPFSLPVKGVETSRFGLQRILNGKPRSPHSGIDIAAPAGTTVHAPADGIVAVVGNFFFNGHTVIINHGQGLVSVYVHLGRISVKQGQRVHRGEPIGEVGATGRTTGADLHWTITLNGTKVDPELLLSAKALESIQ